ncbi:MAG: hypothetical protein LBR22_01460 [Desulfovibrio sp.]|jgi:flagellar biosynthesis/type III secretory pathway protein FliH|nr:hypothetical protein [Desulfovibrio sp.]
MTDKVRKILRQGIPSACRAIGVEEGLEKGIQKGLQDGLRKALLDMMAKRFRIVPETLGEKLCLIQEPDLLNGWVVNFNEYKKLKNFEQDVDAALRQQAMA